MHFLTFVLQSTLLAPLVEFITSSSGHVEPRQGVALGWLGSVVAGLAVVFSTADRTQADDCHGIADGADWVCSREACYWDHNEDPLVAWKYLYAHDAEDGSLKKVGPRSCSCPV